MPEEDLIYLCTSIGNLAGIPVRLYREGELRFLHSLVRLPVDPILPDLDAVLALKDHVFLHATRYSDYYCGVVCGPCRVVVGPSRQIDYTEQELRARAFDLDVPADDVQDFVQNMKLIIRMPMESLLQMMCTLNFAVNREKLTLGDIIGSTGDAFGLEEKRAELALAEELPHHNREVHNTLSVENRVMEIIRTGDVPALEAFAGDAPAVRPGVMAPEPLRQVKNTFIVTAALSARAAMQGGMDAEEALGTSDAYIRRCEMEKDPAAVSHLTYDMVLFLTKRVERLRGGKYPTELVMNVASCVQRHLSEPLTTAQIAEELFISRQHLSRRFSREAGVSLASFVRREKVEEGKRLLRYTPKPVSSIAAYLGFSSQGHFSRVFKEQTGMTPAAYREKKRAERR